MTIDNAKSPSNRPPFRELPVVGLLPHMRRDPLSFYGEISHDCGDVVPLRLGPERLFFLNHPDHVKHVFQDNRDNYEKSHHYDRMRYILGEGLFTSRGDEWKRQRKIAQPSFNGPALKAMFDIMRSATDDMIGRWEGYAEAGTEIDLLPETLRVSLDIALRAMFTTPLTWQAEAIHEAMNVILPELERRVWAIFPFAAYVPNPRKWTADKARKTVHEAVEAIIEDRLASPDVHHDLLSRFIEGERRNGWDEHSIQRLRDQCVVFLIAGHETTATTLAWTWHSLSKYPLVDRRLHREVSETVGDRPVEWEDIGTLHYARQVFEETLRLYPPGWMLTRQAVEDDEIGGYHIPSGATVMLCAHTIHRHPEFWDNPEGFDPSRFAPGSDRSRHAGAYFPFGGGARVCIGKRMSLIGAELILSEVAKRWRLDLASGQKIEPRAMITIRPSAPIHMRLTPRTAAPAVIPATSSPAEVA